jgi:phosphinothricin acetyltransferase
MSDDVLIMRATRADVSKVLELANWAAANTLANLATMPEDLAGWTKIWEDTQAMHPWLVARRGDHVLGFAKAAPHRVRGAYAWTAEVSVYIRADVHGQRIGTRLYNALIPLLRTQGFMTLLAGITTPNPSSERLHAAAGFTRCAVFHRVGFKNNRWIDVGYWELHLQDEDSAPRALRPVDNVWRDPKNP